MPLADDAVRALRNARQREIQDQQLADQAARQMRANRTQQTEQVRMRGPSYLRGDPG
jgi:Tfp pilus assembly protein PilV